MWWSGGRPKPTWYLWYDPTQWQKFFWKLSPGNKNARAKISVCRSNTVMQCLFRLKSASQMNCIQVKITTDQNSFWTSHKFRRIVSCDIQLNYFSNCDIQLLIFFLNIKTASTDGPWYIFTFVDPTVDWGVKQKS